jgi:unsaturated rhamnogalacturonyl hydrolase
MKLHFVAALLGCALVASPALGQGQYRNTDNTNLGDAGEGTYPIPYKKPVVAEVTAQLQAIRAFMDRATPTRIVSKRTGQPITDLKKPSADAVFEKSAGDYGIQVYEMGVVHSGLLKAAQVTKDPGFTAMTRRHFAFFAETLPYFRAQEQQFKLERANSFSRFLDPRSLDDAGSMCAALMRARATKVGPDLKPMIDTCSDWVAKRQFRLDDGTMARKRPQEVSLWADDMYMSIPALAEMGRLTGERAYFDDAVANVMGMSSRMFNPQLGLYTHGWHANHPDAPRFYWARANGWAVLAMSDLLDVLPKDHPGYPKVLAQLRASLKGIAELQSGSGLWHQMIDRNDSYLETSASAIFTYDRACRQRGLGQPDDLRLDRANRLERAVDPHHGAGPGRRNVRRHDAGRRHGLLLQSPDQRGRAARLWPDAAGRRRDHSPGDEPRVRGAAQGAHLPLHAQGWADRLPRTPLTLE